MQGFSFFIRLVLSVIIFAYFVVYLAWVPYVKTDSELMTGFLSVYFNTGTPSGWVRNLLLLSRASFGLLLTLYIFVPSLSFFFEFRAAMYNNTIAIVMAGLTVFFFFLALIIQQVFHI